jgi:hypothetical protein
VRLSQFHSAGSFAADTIGGGLFSAIANLLRVCDGQGGEFCDQSRCGEGGSNQSARVFAPSFTEQSFVALLEPTLAAGIARARHQHETQ